MGIFDFLKGKVAPAAQAPVTAAGPDGVIGPLAQPPTMQHQPSFLERQRIPGPDGLSMADRILMGLMSFNGDTQGALGYGALKRKKTDDTALRQRKNAALKAAYDPVTGKFDPAKYMEGIGPDADAEDAFRLQKDLAGKSGVDGGFAYTIDNNGQVHWGDQRGQSYAEEAAIAREAEAERRNRELEEIARGRLGVAEGQLDVTRQRANRHHGGSGAAIPPPPGKWRPVHQ